MWFFLEGGECEQLVFDEKNGKCEKRILSSRHRDSLVKEGKWQSTRLKEGEWALFATVMCPHYTDDMYSSPDERLLEKHPFLKEYCNV